LAIVVFQRAPSTCSDAIQDETIINLTWFGSITIDGEKYENASIIRLGKEVMKRKKKLSKAINGTSHVISLDEDKYIFWGEG
jgi:hypothetical protein